MREWALLSPVHVLVRVPLRMHNVGERGSSARMGACPCAVTHTHPLLFPPSPLAGSSRPLVPWLVSGCVCASTLVHVPAAVSRAWGSSLCLARYSTPPVPPTPLLVFGRILLWSVGCTEVRFCFFQCVHCRPASGLSVDTSAPPRRARSLSEDGHSGRRLLSGSSAGVVRGRPSARAVSAVRVPSNLVCEHRWPGAGRSRWPNPTQGVLREGRCIHSWLIWFRGNAA